MHINVNTKSNIKTEALNTLSKQTTNTHIYTGWQLVFGLSREKKYIYKTVTHWTPLSLSSYTGKGKTNRTTQGKVSREGNKSLLKHYSVFWTDPLPANLSRVASLDSFWSCGGSLSGLADCPGESALCPAQCTGRCRTFGYWCLGLCLSIKTQSWWEEFLYADDPVRVTSEIQLD